MKHAECDIEISDNKLAEDHVNWFLDMLRPLLISHFMHGLKHGRESKDQVTEEEVKK